MASRRGGADLAAWAALGMALGLCGLGLLSIFFRDFAMVWQPVPASLPHRPTYATASGLILLASGVLMAGRRTRAWGAALAAAFTFLWVVALHLPNALAKPLVLASWQSVCEPLAIAAGAFIAAREGRGGGGRIVPVVIGICFVVFGASHFVYANFTAAMVPAWLPDRLQLTYLTGVIHVLAGLAVIFGVRPRWAAAVEAAMMSAFVLLVHIPRVAADPANRMEHTGLFIAVTLSSAVWILAASRSAATR
jgi:uncharacterized membrane protein YphA (DoxX/SURF4 family)